MGGVQAVFQGALESDRFRTLERDDVQGPGGGGVSERGREGERA